MAVFFGFNAPFFSGPQNILSRQEDNQIIKNDLLQLLFTVPGERVMRPTFGVPLRSFVFEQFDTMAFTTLEDNIRSAIEEFDVRLNVVDVVIVRNDATNGINLTVVVSLKTNPANLITVAQFLSTGA